MINLGTTSKYSSTLPSTLTAKQRCDNIIEGQF